MVLETKTENGNNLVCTKITKRDNILKELFGSLKFKKSTEQILKEVRANL